MADRVTLPKDFFSLLNFATHTKIKFFGKKSVPSVARSIPIAALPALRCIFENNLAWTINVYTSLSIRSYHNIYCLSPYATKVFFNKREITGVLWGTKETDIKSIVNHSRWIKAYCTCMTQLR